MIITTTKFVMAFAKYECHSKTEVNCNTHNLIYAISVIILVALSMHIGRPNKKQNQRQIHKTLPQKETKPTFMHCHPFQPT